MTTQPHAVADALIARFVPDAQQIIRFATELSSGPESTQDFIATKLAQAWVAGGREAIADGFNLASGRISTTSSPRLDLDNLAVEYPFSEADGGWIDNGAQPAD